MRTLQHTAKHSVSVWIHVVVSVTLTLHCSYLGRLLSLHWSLFLTVPILGSVSFCFCLCLCRTHTHTYTYTRIQAHTGTRRHTHIHTCIGTHTSTHTCTHTDTHKHTTQTYIHTSRSASFALLHTYSEHEAVCARNKEAEEQQPHDSTRHASAHVARPP